MAGILTAISKLPYSILALVGGLLLVVLGWFQVVDITKLHLVPLSKPIVALVAVGVILIAASLALENLPRWPGAAGSLGRQAKLAIDSDSVSARIAEATLTVRVGRLENLVDDPGHSLVVLPANEYFDDKCINDTKSVLGAFVQSRLPGRSSQFEAALRAGLKDRPSELLQIDGRDKKAYGLGTHLYLDHPLRETMHLLVAAATTERQGAGLRGDVRSIYTIVRAAYTEAQDHRLDTVYVPLIGAGHGAVRPTRALLSLVVAWCEILYANPGQRLDVNIVAFRGSDAVPPNVSLKHAAELLCVAISVCEPMSGR